MDDSEKRDGKWVTRGIISASECFSCANKIDHRLRDRSVSILCLDPCNYRPLRGERRTVLEDIEDVEWTIESASSEWIFVSSLQLHPHHLSLSGGLLRIVNSVYLSITPSLGWAFVIIKGTLCPISLTVKTSSRATGFLHFSRRSFTNLTKSLSTLMRMSSGEISSLFKLPFLWSIFSFAIKANKLI